MASLVKLKRRIRVARNISKTTRAMQMVAASKMKRAQDSATRGRPYAARLTDVVKNLVGRLPEDFVHPYFGKKGDLPQEKGKILMVVFSPDKGLCGALISNLIRELFNFPFPNKTSFITVGKKLSRIVAVNFGNILADFPIGISQPTFEQIPPLIRIVSEGFLKQEWTQVFVLYPKFAGVFSQKPTIEKLLPIELEEEIITPMAPYYLFEPNVLEVLESLLPHYLESRFYQLLLEAFASEQAARMIAMQNATENAKEIINFLTLEYNKARQEGITNEILDVTRVTQALLEV